MRIRSLICLVLAAILSLSLLSAACADGTLTALFDLGETLLMDTDNVTLGGSADFSLDGVLFKKAEALFQMNHTQSAREWILYTPGEDGTERATGYTVLTNGDGTITAITSYSHGEPGYYYVYPETIKTSILTRTVGIDSLLRLLRATMDPLEAVTEITEIPATDGSKDLVLVFDCSRLPALVDPALNLLFQYGADRYADMDMNSMDLQNNASIHDYLTITQGIWYCTSSLALQDALLTVSLNAAGQVTDAKLEAGIGLTEKNGTAHTVALHAALQISDYGTTEADVMDLDRWNQWN